MTSDIEYLRLLSAEFKIAFSLYCEAKQICADILEKEGVLSDLENAPEISAPPSSREAIRRLYAISKIIEAKIKEVKVELARRELETPLFISDIEQEMIKAQENIRFQPIH